MQLDEAAREQNETANSEATVTDSDITIISDTTIISDAAVDSSTTVYPLPPVIEVKPLDKNIVHYHATKFVLDVLDYCHRKDFPYTLIYTVANLVYKQARAEADSDELGGNAPLKRLVQNDTTFEFAVADVDTTADLSEEFFESIKPKLNLYRKVKCL